MICSDCGISKIISMLAYSVYSGRNMKSSMDTSWWLWYMGVSENSVPLNPMVNDHYPYSMAISLGIYPIFRQTHIGLIPISIWQYDTICWSPTARWQIFPDSPVESRSISSGPAPWASGATEWYRPIHCEAGGWSGRFLEDLGGWALERFDEVIGWWKLLVGGVEQP